MPNWIKGSIKIRSKDFNNIKKFLKEAITYTCHACPLTDEQKEKCYNLSDKDKRPCDDFKPFNKNIKIEEDDDDYTMIQVKDLLLIEDGPSRSYIGKEGETYEEYIELNSKTLIKPCFVLPFQEAWAFDTKGWLALARKYNIDIRLYGIESGMEFVQELEIIDGEITLNREIQYKDWDWQCPFPRMGG